MRARNKEQITIFCGIVLAGALIGICYGGLKGFALHRAPLIGALIGAIHGATIASAIGLIELFAIRSRLGRRLERAPLAITVLGKGVLYITVLVIVQAGGFGAWVIGWRSNQPSFDSPFALLSVVFSCVFILAFIFLLQISRIVGGGTLRDLVLGRYHQPRAEQRFFLFVDVVGSTHLAERLGPLAMHQFLRQVFALAADPVADHKGEIYQYVGDEIVVTWPVVVGRLGARPVGCFFAIEDAIKAGAAQFEREFAVVPRLRAALHAGEVITGEVGDSKRAIVFHGDVMNTTSRLEQATRELAYPFLVSEEARTSLHDLDQYCLKDLGLQELRGRTQPVQVYAVTRVGCPPPEPVKPAVKDGVDRGELERD